MRKALVVGINHYAHLPSLFGCVDDANAVTRVLQKHGDGSVNFGVMCRTADSQSNAVNRGELRDLIDELFADDSEVALLYFAGHGYVEPIGGYLCGSDCQRGDDGLSLTDILSVAHRSSARNKIIVLDSCHSGIAGTSSINQQMAELSEGMTILTASTKEQYANEQNGHGVFTALFVDALNGTARNLVGDVTPGSVYAHVDQSLGPWRQRPVFRTNVKTFVSLRRVPPSIPLHDLQRITEFFPVPGFDFKLDPTFEPEMRGRPEGAPPPDPENTAAFAVLQEYYRANLVVPVDAPHMWHAAIESKSCRLSPLGKHYRRLVAERLI
ncbi:MAG: caspase family protein [Gammaproteobacteria bacterium]